MVLFPDGRREACLVSARLDTRLSFGLSDASDAACFDFRRLRPLSCRAMKADLLIIDDDDDIRTQMRWALAQDYEVYEAGDRASALEVFDARRPPLVTLDLGLPPKTQDVEEGFLLLDAMLSRQAGAKVVVITGQDEKRHALEAIGRGAYDFFPKPIAIDELKVVLKRGLQLYLLERERDELQKRLAGESFEGLLGTSPRMQDVFTAIRRVATTDVSVLVNGESGTGKELVARAIHRLSDRRSAPFVVINCGAIPENLLESELFGHEKGAFTGAHMQRRGRIELAQDGTLLLDEIGELSAPLQVKLLRFLQEKTIERVGGRKETVVDARVMAATNVDLKQAMTDGRFREDLYYRLAVVTVVLPPLRDRGDDVLVLATAFLQRFSAEHKKKIAGFSRDAQKSIMTHRWPGNVRELENRIKRAVIMTEGTSVTPDDLELSHAGEGAPVTSLRQARETLERDLIQKALSRNRGNVTQTASDLGISRPSLYELIEKLGISRA